MVLAQKDVYDNISDIKRVIDCSKRNRRELYRIFLVYGIMQGIYFLLDFAGIWVNIGWKGYYSLGVELACAVITAGLMAAIYFHEKKSSNKYYLATLNIWGTLAISLPFVFAGTRIVMAVGGANASSMNSLAELQNCEIVISILLLSEAFITVGNVMDYKVLSVAAILLLFVFFVTKAVCNFQIEFPVNGYSIAINVDAIWYCAANVLGYLTLGFILLHKERKVGNI